MHSLRRRSERSTILPVEIPEIRYAKSGDIHIAYQVVGDGPIDMVLVPGLFSQVEHHWEEPSFARFMRLGPHRTLEWRCLAGRRGPRSPQPIRVANRRADAQALRRQARGDGL